MILKIQRKIFGIKYFKNVKVEYKQAKVFEVIKFLDLISKKDFNLAEWIIEFIGDNTKSKLTDKDKWQIFVYHEEIFKTLKKTYFKGVFSDKKTSKKDVSPIYSTLAFVSKEGGVNGYDLLYNMTFEDLKLFAEGTVWNLNEQSKKGKRANRLSVIGKKAERTEEEKEAIRQKLSKIK